MPEKTLTLREYEGVSAWIKTQRGEWFHGFNEDIIGSGVYSVGSEPLVIHVDRNTKLFCSDKHAQQLEATGVIRFSPEPQ